MSHCDTAVEPTPRFGHHSLDLLQHNTQLVIVTQLLTKVAIQQYPRGQHTLSSDLHSASKKQCIIGRKGFFDLSRFERLKLLGEETHNRLDPLADKGSIRICGLPLLFFLLFFCCFLRLFLPFLGLFISLARTTRLSAIATATAAAAAAATAAFTTTATAATAATTNATIVTNARSFVTPLVRVNFSFGATAFSPVLRRTR
jgi:hypothetical protein